MLCGRGKRRRKYLHSGLLLFCCAALAGMISGCGVPLTAGPATPVGNYVVTITGTPSDGASPAASTVSLIVTAANH
jgi:hypothetical protein